jgi:hypothetical protein
MQEGNSVEENKASHAGLTPEQIFLNDLWDEHIRHEFSTRNLDATIDTMVTDADVNRVAVRTGEVSNGIHKAHREKQSRDQRRRNDSK